MKTIAFVIFVVLPVPLLRSQEMPALKSIDSTIDTSCVRVGPTPPPSRDGSAAPLLDSLIPVVQFNENIHNHNMHIASDGRYLYTVNGGSSSAGMIKRYTLTGGYLDSVRIQIDFRSLMYRRSIGYFYACGCEKFWFVRNFYRINDIATGEFELQYQDLYDYFQSSLAMSWDGNSVYAFNKGTLKRYSMTNGMLLDSLTGLQCGVGNYGGDGAVAVDSSYIYTWNAGTRTVYVYTFAGSQVDSFVLSAGDNGHSLSVAHGLLFVSKDGNYGTGTWYGYKVGPFGGGTGLREQEQPVATALAQNYPNPFNPMTTLAYTVGVVGGQWPVAGSHVRLAVFDLLGRELAVLVNERKQPGNYEVTFDGTALTSGVYVYQLRAGEYLGSKTMLLLK